MQSVHSTHWPLLVLRNDITSSQLMQN